MFSNKFSSLALIAVSTMMMGCAAQSEKDLLAEAQFCLDRAPSSGAQACLSKISHIENENANSLRCAAGFIQSEVVSPGNLAKAITAISDSEEGGSMVMLASLSFPNKTLATDTNVFCAKSGSAGMALLAAMAKSATIIASIGITDGSSSLGSCSSDPDQMACMSAAIEANLGDLINIANGTGCVPGPGHTCPTLTPEQAVDEVIDIVSSIQEVYAATCTTVVVNQDMCGEIDKALATAGSGGTPILPAEFQNATPEELKTIGLALLEQWKSGSQPQ